MKFIQIMLAVAAAAAIVYFGLDAISPSHETTLTPAKSTTANSVSDMPQNQVATNTTASDDSADADAGSVPGTSASTNNAITRDQAQQISRPAGFAAANQGGSAVAQDSSGTGDTKPDQIATANNAPANVYRPPGTLPASDPSDSAAIPAPRSAAINDTHSAHDGNAATSQSTPVTAAVGQIGSDIHAGTRSAADTGAVQNDPDNTAGHGAATASVSRAAPARSVPHHTPAHTQNMPEPAQPDQPMASASTALLPWWTPSADVKSGQFALVFAGRASFAKAIVLLFSKPVSTASSSDIRVINAQGQPVEGTWTASDKNPRMLIFNTEPGHYTVSVPGNVEDSTGTNLGRGRSGPVVVR